MNETTDDGLVPAPRRRGAVSPGVPQQYAAVMAGYRSALEQAGVAELTRRAYASRVAGFLRWLDDTARPALAGTSPGADLLHDPQFRELLVGDYQAWLLTVARKAPNTVNAHLTAVDDFYRRLGLGPVRAARVDPLRRRAQALDQDQICLVLHAASRLPLMRDTTIVRLLYYAGLRTTELVALDVDDVSATARTGTVIVRAGPNGTPRTVPAHRELRRTLIAYRPIRRALPGADTCPALLLNRYGRRLSTRAVEKLITDLGAAVGLPGLVPYALRHTCAADLLHAGTDTALVAQLLDQASLHRARADARPTETDRARAVEALHGAH